MNDFLDTTVAKVVGLTAPWMGLVISHADVNTWLQTISLLLGCAVGVVTLYKSLTKKRRK